MAASRWGEGSNEELVFSGDIVSVWEDEKVLVWTVGMVVQQCGWYLTQEKPYT